ncbi:MAG: type II secretion system F family protein [Actinomycetota bacterium]
MNPASYSLLFGLGMGGLFFANLGRIGNNLPSRIEARFNPSIRFTDLASSNKPGLKLKLRLLINSQDRMKINRAVSELGDIIDLVGICLAAGDSSFQALSRTCQRARGEVAGELTKILRKVEFGASLAEEIKQLPERLPHPQISEFASKVSISLLRGTPLAQMLHDQASSLRAANKNSLLRQAGKNETRMLIPLVFLILPVTVVFAIYPSLKLLNFSYF